MTISPYLPAERLKLCLIGERYIEETEELSKLNIECIPLKKNPFLDDEIGSHADILAFNLGNGKILINKGSAGEDVLRKQGYDVTEIQNVKSPYPDDIALNTAFAGKDIICNKKYTATEIINFASDNGINIIHTKQGYTKCNLCFVADKAVITEDDGLAHLLKIYQYDVLKLEKGFVSLSDEHYGFIGGAAAKLSASELYFSGDITAHPEYDRIIEFLNKYNVIPIFNPNRALRDFGGIVPLR